MPNIRVDLKRTTDRSYTIFIQKDSILELPDYLKKHTIGEKYAIITDDKTQKLFGNALLRNFRKHHIQAEIITFEEGEKSKRLSVIESLAEKMVEKEFTRKDAIIALGGGVVGDIAGFLASIYFRGIPYIQIPTTLLAMVDSSIGGKTGVDLICGKNLIGTTTQPATVFIDTNYLKTLPVKQIRNGLAEIIKYGIIADEKLFKFIEQNLEKIFAYEEKAINYIIKRSVEIKVKIIEEDEKEKGKRMLLNYGHTYGHALERLSNYTLLHGYAISIGMVIINDIAIKKKLLKKAEAERIKKLFKSVELPTTTMKKPTLKDIASDKKREGDYINLVFPTKIGHAIILKENL